ncbi:hypothetical protein LUZ63_000935 [Rhynchospora breviuscula]|uniref:Uncharacterized protein n=1 Tax=Rhynchospora breviuscula TaxID=2022672 RepID=A0A9Q0HWL0_9POAL|nr:hypothetical protein LUZ63_000935 [Rhynchospora breviuscula]
MYDNFASGPGADLQGPRQPSPFGSAFYGAGSGFIKSGLGAYGEKYFGSNSEFQNNVSRFFSNPQYYFNVNDQYVCNKLKVILLPFLHRGHWTRIAEPVGGRLSFKPPVQDINAPDLYIPFMAFATFIILAGFSLGFVGKFSPEALSMQFTRAVVGWVLQIAVLKSILSSLGSGEVPFLDVASYSGYAFAGLSITIIMKLIWGSTYYFIMPCMSLCMGIFLVKTAKRIIFTEARNYERRSSRQNYLLLFVAIAQFPFFFLLGRIGA